MNPGNTGKAFCCVRVSLFVQGEAVELAIRLLTGQQRKPPSDKALRSDIGRTMLQASTSCQSGTANHDVFC